MLEGGGNLGQQTPRTQLQSIIFHWCLFYVVASGLGSSVASGLGSSVASGLGSSVASGLGSSVEIFHPIQESAFLLKLIWHSKHFMSVDVSIKHFTLQHTLHANPSLM